MITTIILILSFLVATNFLLLVFSCNKIPKKRDDRKPPYLKPTKASAPTLVSSQLQTNQLAPTGS